MSDIKITAIMPVYNVENFIGKCIESLQNQTLTEWELIAVDDGSPDNSGAICDEYAQKDSRITVIHKENGGVTSARTVGAKEATGEYLLFLDSDDWWENDEVLLNNIFDKYTSTFRVSLLFIAIKVLSILKLLERISAISNISL